MNFFIKATFPLMISLAFSLPLNANANTDSCAAGWTTNPVKFESAIQYDDMLGKANPTVHLLINGKMSKMMLDTGANANSIWDMSLLDEKPSSDLHRVDAHIASVDARTVGATLEDAHGNVLRQEFFLVPESVLAADGYVGMISPQAIAQENAVVMDFKKNCFFTSSQFDIRSSNGFDAYPGAAVSNPYRVMEIPVEIDGRKIPLVVDSGSSDTVIAASLLESKPKGQKSGRAMDMFGAEIPHDNYMRIVDLNINGKIFASFPVTPRLDIRNNGIEAFGYIGMDILKDHIIYYDPIAQNFVLLASH